MIFEPDSIKKQEFNKSFRGFDREEVHAFLEKLASDFGTILSDNEALKKELEETKRQLEKFLQAEDKIKASMVEAREEAKKIIEESQRKAGEILSLAEEKSTELLQNSREDLEKLKKSIASLREEKEIIISKLKAVIGYQNYLLETKLQETAEEIKEIKKPAAQKGIGIDVNDVVQKLL